jgi:prolipoprotein diacylglyceryltransferase
MDMLGLPRHPAMVYESISNFLLFIFLFMMWKKNKDLPEGMLFSLFVIILFSLRFFYEFLKENQVDFEDGLALNMGQNLSIPMVLAGLFLLWRSLKSTEKKIN